MVFGPREQSCYFVGGLWRFGAWVAVLIFWLLGASFWDSEVFCGFGIGLMGWIRRDFGVLFWRILGNNRVDLSLGDALDERRFEACKKVVCCLVFARSFVLLT